MTRGPIRGILLAGGRGNRLYPLTATTSKQLMAVYNKPMIYYPLTTMLMAGVKQILVISSPDVLHRYEQLMGDGSHLGVEVRYASQEEPRGIADALLIGEAFIGDSHSMLMLGDNIIYGRLDFLRQALADYSEDAIVFGYQVSNPEAYGVVDFDREGRAVRLEEKPNRPRSNWAVPGIYFYPPGVSELARSLEPSDRGELEITDLNQRYLEAGLLRVVPMGRGIAWFDTGTPRALLEASNFVEAIERRQGLIIGSPEEVAYRMGYLDDHGLRRACDSMPESEYRRYLEALLEER